MYVSGEIKTYNPDYHHLIFQLQISPNYKINIINTICLISVYATCYFYVIVFLWTFSGLCSLSAESWQSTSHWSFLIGSTNILIPWNSFKSWEANSVRSKSHFYLQFSIIARTQLDFQKLCKRSQFNEGDFIESWTQTRILVFIFCLWYQEHIHLFLKFLFYRIF